MKPRLPDFFTGLLRAIGSLVLLATLLLSWQSAQAQSSTRAIGQPNQDYGESTTDLLVKVLGGTVEINRSWTGGKWYLNDRWSDLTLLPDPLGGVLAVSRADRVYTRSNGSSLYTLNVGNYIAQITDTQGNTTGWQWRDQSGNTIDYDAAGHMLGYANPAGVHVTLVRDANGRWSGVQDHLGHQVLSISYNAAGLPVQVSDNGGHSVSYQWSGSAATSSPNGAIGLTLLTQVTDSRGGIWKYTYTGNGYIQNRTDPAGGQITLNYLTQPTRTINTGSTSVGSTVVNQPQTARVANFKDEVGAITNYTINYNSTTQQYLVGIQLPGGASQSTLYDNQGRILQDTLNGEVQSSSYSISNGVVSQQKDTNQRGLITTTDYNGAQLPIKITYPDGSTETNQYDAQNHKTQNVNALGVISKWSYDAKGNVTKYVEASGKPEQRTTLYTYDSYGQMLTKTRGAGDGTGADAVTQAYQYDDYGNVVKYTDPLGNSTTATYNSQGLILTKTNPLNQTTTNTYDAAGNLLTATNALNQTTQYSYDGRGRKTQTTSAAGRVKATRYDLAGRVLETLAPGQTEGQGTRTAYDQAGNPVQITSPGGLVTKTTYDLQGRTASTTDPAGNVTTYQYGTSGDPLAGLLTAIQYPTYKETYQYDQRGRRTGVTQQLGSTSTTRYQVYDAAGQLVSTTDANSNSTVYAYDALGRMTQTTDPLQQNTQQTWDEQDNCTSLTDAKGNTHTFQYNKVGHLVKETRPMGGAIQYSYNATGQLIQRTDAAGNTRTYTYNAAGNVTAKEHKFGGTTLDERITYSYDADGQLTAYQQQDGGGNLISSATYTLDTQGRITQSTIAYGKVDGSGTFSFTLGQSFNADGQLASNTYPDGSQSIYGYSQGLLAQVTLPNSSQINYGNYSWQTPTNIQTPGAKKTITVDALQRPIQIAVTNTAARLLASRQYQYDPAGNITEIDSDIGQTQYSYDKLDRLTQAYPDRNLQLLNVPLENYSYDLVGNRIASLHQPGTWTYNQDNQLTQYPKTTPFSLATPVDTEVTYTPQGHTDKEVNQQGEQDYHYNAAERLTQYTSTPAGTTVSSIQANYWYDPFGRRIAKSITQGANTTTTFFIYGQQGLLAETDQNGTVTKVYGFNPVAAQKGLWSTDPIWQANANNGSLTNNSTDFYYLYTDYLGTPMLATDKNGVSSWKVVTEVFGAANTLPESSITMNLRFPGQYLDQETGTHYNFQRNFSPIQGRYMESDPIGLLNNINIFTYSADNPLKYFDDIGTDTKNPPLTDLSNRTAAFLKTICKKKDESCKDYFSRLYKTCTGLLAGFGGVACEPMLSWVHEACPSGDVPICPDLFSCIPPENRHV